MNNKQKENFKLIRRHPLLVIINVIFSIFLLLISSAILYLSFKYGNTLDRSFQLGILFPLLFITINVAFIRLILFYIHYYNNLIVIKPGELIVIKSTLLDTDNIEVIDNSMITKLDTKLEGVISNIFSYGDMIIEQNRDRTRVFNHMYKPYKVVNTIKEMRKIED